MYVTKVWIDWFLDVVQCAASHYLVYSQWVIDNNTCRLHVATIIDISNSITVLCYNGSVSGSVPSPCSHPPPGSVQRRDIYQQYSGQLTSILCVLFVVFYCLVEVYMYVMKSVFFFNCLWGAQDACSLWYMYIKDWDQKLLLTQRKRSSAHAFLISFVQ